MTVTLHDDGRHKCYVFHDLVGGAGVQANQFLLNHNGHLALLDPGGELSFLALFDSLRALHQDFDITRIEYIIASHQDPDVLSTTDKWLAMTRCKLVVPAIWSRFLYHGCKANKALDRLLPVPDEGLVLPFGDSELLLVPGHFLHSEGCIQVFDPVSRILFSSDLGSWMGEKFEYEPVSDFDLHVPGMIDFHRRLMGGNRVCRLWAAMARTLDIEKIVPQHGPPFRGKEMVGRFLEWIEQLECGIDLMGPEHYRVPGSR